VIKDVMMRTKFTPGGVSDTGREIAREIPPALSALLSRRDSGTGLGWRLCNEMCLNIEVAIRAETNHPHVPGLVIDCPRTLGAGAGTGGRSRRRLSNYDYGPLTTDHD